MEWKTCLHQMPIKCTHLEKYLNFMSLLNQAFWSTVHNEEIRENFMEDIRNLFSFYFLIYIFSDVKLCNINKYILQ